MPLFGRKKFDAVVVAVRLDEEGQIDWLRAFERRGATWSDYHMVQRAEAIQRISDGELFMTGERIEFQAGTFKTYEQIHVQEKNGKQVLIAGAAGSNGDSLAGVPAL